MTLRIGKGATLIGSTEPWPTVLALGPEDASLSEQSRRERLLDLAHPAARTGPAAELVLAADQFIMTPAGRVEDAARARATGDEVRSVIAGYHWFTDWGRDTMISLEGPTLTTGRHAEAGWILQTFAHYIQDGLIPNIFPEGKSEGLYHTAVLEVVRDRLLTPAGLRSLSREHPDYKSRYFGDLRARDCLSPGNSLGMANRPFRGCMAQGASQRSGGCPKVYRERTSAPRSSVRRLDQ